MLALSYSLAIIFLMSYFFSFQPMIGSADWLDQREKLYSERNRRIEDVCNGHLNIHKSQSQGTSFWFDLPPHLTICMHAKVKNCTLLGIPSFLRS